MQSLNYDNILEMKKIVVIHARIAQLVAYRLCTGVVPGSNPDKGENFSVKSFSLIFSLIMY